MSLKYIAKKLQKALELLSPFLNLVSIVPAAYQVDTARAAKRISRFNTHSIYSLHKACFKCSNENSSPNDYLQFISLNTTMEGRACLTVQEWAKPEPIMANPHAKARKDSQRAVPTFLIMRLLGISNRKYGINNTRRAIEKRFPSVNLSSFPMPAMKATDIYNRVSISPVFMASGSEEEYVRLNGQYH